MSASIHVLKAAELNPESRPPFDMSGRHTIALGLRAETVGAKNFSVNVIGLAPGFGTPLHSHVYEEGWCVLAGAGLLRVEDERHPFEEGDLLYVGSDVPHQVVNPSNEPLKLLAITVPPVDFLECRILAPFDPDTDLR